MNRIEGNRFHLPDKQKMGFLRMTLSRPKMQGAGFRPTRPKIQTVLAGPPPFPSPLKCSSPFFSPAFEVLNIPNAAAVLSGASFNTGGNHFRKAPTWRLCLLERMPRKWISEGRGAPYQRTPRQRTPEPQQSPRHPSVTSYSTYARLLSCFPLIEARHMPGSIDG